MEQSWNNAGAKTLHFPAFPTIHSSIDLENYRARGPRAVNHQSHHGLNLGAENLCFTTVQPKHCDPVLIQFISCTGLVRESFEKTRRFRNRTAISQSHARKNLQIPREFQHFTHANVIPDVFIRANRLQPSRAGSPGCKPDAKVITYARERATVLSPPRAR